jgi:hypothetical protein
MQSASCLRFNNSSKTAHASTIQRRIEEEIVLVLAVVVIISSIVCFVAFYSELQRAYDGLSESVSHVIPSFTFVVEKQWTNNFGVDSNYINCTGTVWNLGLREARDVTLIVDIRDINDTLLKRERILIGNIGPLQDKAFYVNVYYSGILANVSIATTHN